MKRIRIVPFDMDSESMVEKGLFHIKLGNIITAERELGSTIDFYLHTKDGYVRGWTIVSENDEDLTNFFLKYDYRKYMVPYFEDGGDEIDRYNDSADGDIEQFLIDHDFENCIVLYGPHRSEKDINGLDNKE